jgi:hypothetical protein
LNRIREVVPVWLCVFLLTSVSAAQALPTENIYGGYSYLSSNLLPNSRSGLNGWNGSLELKPLRYFGLLADFSGHYGSQTFLALTPNCPTTAPVPPACVISGDVHQHDFLIGLRGGASIGRFRPFAEVTFGVVHLQESSSNFIKVRNAFAEALGTGVDYRLARRFGWRFQLDYLQTALGLYSVEDIRLSTGALVYF